VINSADSGDWQSQRAQRDRRAEAIDRFNHQLHQDQRVTIAMLPVSDGITLAMKNH
jgi:predicted O-methyltransferase YrrM